MSIYVNEVVYVLLVLGALIIVAAGLVEIITFLATRFCDWFTRQVSLNGLVTRVLHVIRIVWRDYTEYLADLVFFGFALAFLIEKLANIPNITLIVLVQTMNTMSWLWIAVLVSAVLWIYSKRTMRKRLEKERMGLADKIDSGFTEVNKNLNILINEIRKDRDERNKL